MTNGMEHIYGHGKVIVYFFVFFAWMVSRTHAFRTRVVLHFLSMSYSTLLEKKKAKQKVSCVPLFFLFKYVHICKFVTFFSDHFIRGKHTIIVPTISTEGDRVVLLREGRRETDYYYARRGRRWL